MKVQEGHIKDHYNGLFSECAKPYISYWAYRLNFRRKQPKLQACLKAGRR